MAVVRNTSEGLQVPFDVWTKNGHIVRLEGVCHVAPAEYWDRLQSYLLEGHKKGYHLHLEGIRKDAENEDIMSEKALRGLRAIFEGQKAMGEAAGLVYQKLGMAKLYAAVETEDYTNSQMIEAYDIEKLENLADKPPVADTIEELDKISPHLGGKAVLFFLRNMNILSFISALSRKPMLDPLVIVKGRNEYAVGKVLEVQSPTSMSVMLWGAAHIPGMRKLFKKAGYKRVATGWKTIIPRSHTVDGAA